MFFIFKKIIFTVFLCFILLLGKNVSAQSFDSKKDQVYLGGETVGLKLNTGVTISKTFAIVDGINLLKPWQDADIRENDIIVSYNDVKIESTSDLLNEIRKSKDSLCSIAVLRGENLINSKIKPVIKDDSYTLGIYVKDNIVGVGTLTYVMPVSNIFGALGHKIDGAKNIGGLMYEATVTGIKKGSVGEAGSKRATINTKTIGKIEKNTITGIHGIYNGSKSDRLLVNVTKKEDVKLGSAQIVTCIDKKYIDYYDIEIVSVLKQSSKDIKGIKFKVTDPKLLSQTNGIVQGMSGSPIIQNGNLVGAVTHVLVNNPHEGYGIFIEFMFSDMGIELL